MSDLVWLLATAARNVEADVAAVSWNHRVSVLLPPGQASRDVLEPRCEGSSTGCPESLRALAGLLGLRSRGGVRVVVVASDGRLPNRAAVEAEVTSLVDAGVVVGWVSPEPDGWRPAASVPMPVEPRAVIDAVTRLVARG